MSESRYLLDVKCAKPAPTLSNLVFIGTTAIAAKSRRISAQGKIEVAELTALASRKPRQDAEWWAGVDAVWHARTLADVARLRQRARSERRRGREAYRANALFSAVTAERSAQWADWRARSVALGRRDLVDTCGARTLTVRCGCGSVALPVGCGVATLCQRCSARMWRKWRRRIGSALTAHERGAVATWGINGGRGMRPGVYLVTLTAPHSGDLVADRQALATAWRSVSKAASAGKWWGAHVSVFEATPGTDGGGHVHLHVCAVSSWLPYEALRSVWSRAVIPRCSHRGACYCVERAGAHVHISAPKARNGAFGAANYVAKYVTKGVQPGEMSAQKCGELLVAQRNRRKVTASRGFWAPALKKPCRKCGKSHVLDSLPASLLATAPSACWRSLARGVVDTPRIQLTAL